MKSTLSIVAFIITFGFSFTVVGLLFGFPQANLVSLRDDSVSRYGYHNLTGEKLEDFIIRDIRNGNERGSRIRVVDMSSQDRSVIAKYSGSVNNYLRKSGSLDYSDLPVEFQRSWRKHMQAWEDYADFLNERKNTSKMMNTEEFISIERNLDHRISATWRDTLLTAEKYGASVR